MTYAFIVNPAAGRRRPERIERVLQEQATARDVVYTLHRTTHPGHAADLAEQASRAADVVVAVGGDGTVHEIAAGLLRSRFTAHLGVVPTGSGNDFARQIGLPPRWEAAVAALFDARPRRIDYGVIEARDAGGQHRQGVFINAAGIGFDAEVARRAERDKALPGLPGYLLTALRTLGGWRPPTVTAQLCGDEPAAYAGPLLMLCIGNGRSAGGGFLLTPHASVHDGWLDVCLVPGLPLRRILRLVPEVVAGRLWHAPEVQTARVASVHLCSDTAVPVHVDGELLSGEAREVHVHLRRAACSVCMPLAGKMRK